MKKALLFLTGAALLFAGCSKVENEIVPEEGKHKVTLNATVAEDTRISANAAGAFSWQAGDEIVVFTTDENDELYWERVATEDTGASASFELELDPGYTLGGYAFYPAAYEGYGIDCDGVVEMRLEEEYDYIKDATYMPMMATITPEGASFKAVGGVLKLIVYNVPADAARLVFTAHDMVITGTFPVIDGEIAAEGMEGEHSVTMNFAGKRETNMVFYIPLPTGVYEGFELSFLTQSITEIEGGTKSTSATLNVTRNKMIIAPALNMGGVIVDDATLSNADILAAGLPASYPDNPVSYTNASGTWKIAGIKGGNYQNSGNWFAQIRNNTKLSYIQLPVFENEISSIVLKKVSKTTESGYATTEKVYFRTEANNSGTNVATASRAENEEDITLSIPNGYKTGFIMSSTTCLIESIIVKFNAGTPAIIPVISYEGNDNRTVGAGKLNCNITGVKLSDPLDGNGIAVVIDPAASWISSATITGDVTSSEGATVTVTAGSYNHYAEARTGKVYLRATGAKQKTITITQSPSIVNNPASLTAVAGNETFTVSWTGDSKVASYKGYYSTTANLENPASGTPLTITNEGTAYSATPSGTVANGTTYYIYVKAATLTEAYADKYAIAEGWTKAEVTPQDPTAEKEATIVFGNTGTKINGASVTGKDSENNTWTITTVGTTSYTQNSGYTQVGKKDEPATSITFTTTLPDDVTSVNSIAIKLGGYNSTAGDVTLKVGSTVVGTGSLDESNDVIVSSANPASGNTITITVTNIARGVKVYNITTKYQ